MHQSLLRPFAALLAALLMIQPASATWSVILVNRVTKEVVVAGATCLTNLDLELFLPVVRVGHGAACAQSAIDSGAINRQKIWAGFLSGKAPAGILSQLALEDPAHQSRQYGIVDVFNKPTSFTGNGAGQGKKNLSGLFGDWSFSVQGNVLTGPQVVDALESALKQTQGDAGQRVLQAMLDAYALGGDGRCSCSILNPTSCGVPPPSFTKSAHVGFFIIARVGDLDGTCTGSLGCATGQYFLDLNVIGGSNDPDPVLSLQSQYLAWRAARVGLADQLQSKVTASAPRLVADGQSQVEVLVELIDIDGLPLNHGGAQLAVGGVGGSALLGQVGPPVDLGNGSYRFSYQAGTAVGLESLRIEVDEGNGAIVLQPDLSLALDPLAPLHAGFQGVSATTGAQVPLTVHLAPLEPFLILGSFTGSSPGLFLPFGLLPLNYDALFEQCLIAPNSGALVGTLGTCDANGWAQAQLSIAAGVLNPLVGGTLDWAVVGLGAPLSASPAVDLLVLP